MRTLRSLRFHLALPFVSIPFALPIGHLAAQQTTTSPICLDVYDGLPNNQSFDVTMDGSGRFAVFTTAATDLFLDFTNGQDHIYRRDLVAGVHLRASVSSSGAQGDDDSWEARISANGRFVAFTSEATNLVTVGPGQPADTNFRNDAFVHDCELGITVRVSLTANNTQLNAHSTLWDISGDGSKVLFSTDGDVIPFVSNGTVQLYVRDLLAGTVALVSKNSAGQLADPPDAFGIAGVLSDDGLWVAFHTSAANLWAFDNNDAEDVFLRDLQNSTTIPISRNYLTGYTCELGARNPSITANGDVVFTSWSADLVQGDTNFEFDVFFFDRDSGPMGTNTRVSVGPGGIQANGSSLVEVGESVAADGRFVAFYGSATNLLASVDVNSAMDVFVRDRTTGTTTLASVATDGTQGDSHSMDPAMSGNGRFAIFESDATNLYPGAGFIGTEVFARDRYVLFAPGCFGNPAMLKLSNGFPAITTTVEFTLITLSQTSGAAVAVYFGQDARDASGCGFPLSGYGEMMLGVVPAPTLLVSGTTTGTGLGTAATMSVTIPNQTSLVGVQVFFQGSSVQSGAIFPIEMTNSLGVVFTQ